MFLVEEYYNNLKELKTIETKIILLFQVGNFYEAYSNEEKNGCAVELSQILHMQLTKKNNKKAVDSIKNPYQCGFPTYMIMKHITKINDEGYAVAIYDQNKNDPKIRTLSGIYTPNIRREFDDQESTENAMLCCYFIEKYPVQEGHVRYYEYSEHYCWIDMCSGNIYMAESTDTDFMRMVEQFLLHNRASEILLMTKNFETEEKRQITQQCEKRQHLRIICKEVSNEKCNEFILEKSITNYENEMFFHYPILKQCLSFLLEYIEKHDCYYLKELYIPDNAWVKQGKSSLLHFNRDLYKELFIFQIDDSRQSENIKVKSLFQILSNGMNIMATRYFRNMLLHPLNNVEKIKNNQKQLQKKYNDEHVKQLQHVLDLEWYFLRWRRENLNKRLVSNMFMTYSELTPYYPELSEMMEEIESMWNLEALAKFPTQLEIYEDFFLSTPLKELKDVVQNLYLQFEKMENDTIKLVLKEEQIDMIHFEISSRKWTKMNSRQRDVYRVIEKTSSVIRVIPHTLEQVRCELTCKWKELRNSQEILYKSQCEEISKKWGNLIISTNEKIKTDSVFSVLQQFFWKHGYVCPTLKNSSSPFINAKKLRHAIIEYLNPNDIYVPCNVEINNETSKGKLIYGMNSSGKSTYMKSIGLSLWLAQCGLFVPASKFEFYPFEKIYSKFCHFDNLFQGHSLFVSEMSELDYMLKNSNPNTLLLLDEMTSGTEVHSSSSLIISVIEHFMSENIKFCFTTHIHWISKVLCDKYQDIEAFHFLYDKDKDIRKEKLLTTNVSDFYNRSIQKGSGPSMYGIEVAEKLGLPTSIIKRAFEIRSGIHFYHKPVSPAKNSKYNQKLIVDKCFKCNCKEHLHTHHIFPQQEFTNTKQNEGFRKDALYNLVVLCEKCHQNIHHSKL